MVVLRAAAILLWPIGMAWAEGLPMTSVEEIKALGSAQAEQERRPVLLKAFVIGTSHSTPDAYLQEDGESILADYRLTGTLPLPNSEVEITGITRGARPNQRPDEPRIEITSMRVLNEKVAPPPIIAKLEEVVRCQYARRWVEIEGTVLQIRRAGNDLQVILAGDIGWMVFNFRGLTPPEMPLHWLNARLRVRGMNLDKPDLIGTTLTTYDLMNIDVVTPGHEDCFQVPAGNASNLLMSNARSGNRVRLTATVLHTAQTPPESWIWLRDDAGTPFFANFILPWKPDPLEPQFTSPTVPNPVLRAGDLVEIVGSPLADPAGLGFWLRYCEARIVRSGGNSDPLPIDGAGIADGLHRHNLVTFKGRAISQTSATLQAARRVEAVRLRCGEKEVEAYLETPDGGHLVNFSTDDLIEVTGLVSGDGGGPKGRLMLRSASDIRSLGTAPEVIRAAHLRNLIIAGGGGLLALGVIFMMRRRLRRERFLSNEIRVLNASLEIRVKERTMELEQARADLHEALKEEREVGELKSRFVSSVSHEFRTPLGVIMSATDLLSRYRDRLPAERIGEHLQEIRHATRQMSGMMEDILLLGRAEAGRVDIKPQAVDLPELCTRLADETKSAAAQSGRTIITSEPLPGLAQIDEMLFRHIFGNLLHNAIKYSPEGSEVNVHIRAEGSKTVITITDHGIGIPLEDQPKLFEPFARADNVGHLPGTGLGLVVVKRCAELHGGGVNFTSQPGEGTTFTITLPVWN